MKVEYLSCRGKRWHQGELVREWKNGDASIRNDLTGDGWLVIRKGEWRKAA